MGVFAHFQQRSAKSVKSNELAVPFHMRRRASALCQVGAMFCPAASVVSCFFPLILKWWK